MTERRRATGRLRALRALGARRRRSTRRVVPVGRVPRPLPGGPHRGAGARRGRLTALAVVIGLLLTVLVGRLGQVQLVRSDAAVTVAGPDTRTVTLPAVRGRILDRHGIPLVDNAATVTVTMDRRVFTDQREQAVASLTALATLLGVAPGDLVARAHLCGEEGAPPPPVCWNGSPQVPVPVARAVDPARVLTLLERPDRFPGLGVRTDVGRRFPAPGGVNAAHVLGHLGRVSQDELTASDGALVADDLIGRAGLEATYDAALRGRSGSQVVAVDPRGLVLREVSRTPPVPGRDLVTTLDAGVQAAAERSLAEAMEAARARGEVADSGAVVVLDVTDGAVLAAVSAPTYDPAVWTGGISSAAYAALTDPAGAHPLLSRVDEVALAPASTIKALSVPAAVAAGNRLDGSYACPASYQIGDRAFHNYESTAHGSLSLADALRVSCDTIFYDAAYRSWLAQGGIGQASDAHDPFIAMDRAFGLGQRTGVDLPGEAAGRVPGREAKRATWEATREDLCARAVTGYPELATTDPERAAYLTQVAVENCQSGFQYRAGDAANLAIGQGELAVTPLQMAVAYAALANGGTLLTPRVGRALVDPATGGEEAVPAGPTRATGADPGVTAYVAEGLRSVVTGGTAAGAFAGMAEDWPVAGKTGTAEVLGRGDTSWFVSWAPSTAPRYAVAVVVSQGGTGAETAAPVARAVHEALRAAGP
jgi:penicillin-binding protein 2